MNFVKSDIHLCAFHSKLIKSADVMVCDPAGRS